MDTVTSNSTACRGVSWELEHRFSPVSRLLCASEDDFMLVKLADAVRETIKKSAS